ncbi:MAG: LysR substrate-binding domain-containing protein [Caulobacteraceae bacterium]
MFDVVLLRSFLAVVETGHFTAAGRALSVSQSTISQHIRRLERAAGRELLARDTHAVALTADGNVMAGYAREIVGASQSAADYFADAVPRTRIRFGVSEDFVLTCLPDILRCFMESHPLVSVDLTMGLSSTLYQKLDSGRVDLILAKRRADDERGLPVWRERLAWMAHPDFVLSAEAPAPLVLYATASITGGLALEALNRAGRSWFVASSSDTLGGLRAAVLAGLGVTAQSRLLLQPGDLAEVSDAAGLPPLGDIEFVLVGRSTRLQGAVAALAQSIQDKGERIWTGGPR